MNCEYVPYYVRMNFSCIAGKAYHHPYLLKSGRRSPDCCEENSRVRQTILRAEYSGFRIDFLLLLWAVIKIKNLFCANFYFLPTFFVMLLSPPKNREKPNLQHENSDAPSAGYNNHIALLISHFNTKIATGRPPRTWPSAQDMAVRLGLRYYIAVGVGRLFWPTH